MFASTGEIEEQNQQIKTSHDWKQKAFLKEFAVKKLWTKYISKNIKLSNVTKHCLEQNHCKKREAFFAYYLFFSHKYMKIFPLLQLRTWRMHF